MNSCGNCTACCEVFHIPVLNKPQNTLCKDCTGFGCGIYDSRPQTCKDYQCIYIRSDMPEELRPDKCGVILEFLKDGTCQAAIFKGKVFETDPIMKYIKTIEVNNGINVNIAEARPEMRQA